MRMLVSRDHAHAWTVDTPGLLDTFTRVSLLGLLACLPACLGASKHLLLCPSIRCIHLETTWLTAAEKSRCGESWTWREVLLVLTLSMAVDSATTDHSAFCDLPYWYYRRSGHR